MKRWIHIDAEAAQLDQVFGMANIVPKRSGIAADVWSDHKGIERQVSHRGCPRAKISYQGHEISVSIEAQPQILAPANLDVKKGIMKKLQEGMDYVGRNYDLFLKHYNDISDEFDDEALFAALRNRGEYK